MKAAAVAQLEPLAGLFAEVLRLKQPTSVAVLGIAGGNGLDCIDTHTVTRVVGVDINPSYLDAVRKRYPQLHGIELHCADLAAEALVIQPVQLVHAALLFEHAGTARCLDNALSLVAPGGSCSIVLQLPGQPGQDVGRTGIASIQKLACDFTLIDPGAMRQSLEERGFQLAHEQRIALPAGKGLWMGIFARA